MRPVLFAVALSMSACAFGAPPGFSSGDTWTFPLVEPQQGGRLLTPVYVEGRGPYLFAIDTDEPETTVDPEVIGDRVEFRTYLGPRRLDESDTFHPTFYTRFTHFKVGDLTVSLLPVAQSAPHAFDTDGRRIYGVLGRDILADSLVFGFDRDRGVAWLQTQEAFKAPANAQVLEYKKVWSQPLGDPRKLLATKIDGHEFDLHIDLGEAVSQLWPRHWLGAELKPLAWHLVLTDETGMHRDIDHLGIAQQVSVGEVSRDRIAFAPYEDRRYYYNLFDGTLGLDFFRPYNVAVSWHHTTIYLTPRAQVPLADRIARWGWSACPETGCVQLALQSTQEQPKPTLRVARAAALAGEVGVIIKATGMTGAPLPSIEASFPAGVDHLSAELDSMYAGATLEIADASPFPRTCANPAGCLVIEQPTPP